MRRFSTSATALLLAGCAWRQSEPRDRLAYQNNPAADALEVAAASYGAREVEVDHALCTSKPERLAGLEIKPAEVGRCAEIRTKVPATAAAVRAAAARQCAEAMRRGVIYAYWSAIVGEQHFFVAGAYQQIRPLHPRSR